MSTRTISLAEVRQKLLAEGFTGLIYPGECACGLDDLAPCGECQKEEGEEYINGCDGAYKHVDPRSDHRDWVISTSKEPPTPAEFDRAFANT